MDLIEYTTNGRFVLIHLLQEIEEMESPIDNDRFLYSLESAIFTASDESPSIAGTQFNESPFYSSISASSTHSAKFQDGDLGTHGSGKDASTLGSRFHPPLPPGSPVVGFAYLGLGGGFQEEDPDETQTIGPATSGAFAPSVGAFNRFRQIQAVRSE